MKHIITVNLFCLIVIIKLCFFIGGVSGLFYGCTAAPLQRVSCSDLYFPCEWEAIRSGSGIYGSLLARIKINDCSWDLGRCALIREPGACPDICLIAGYSSTCEIACSVPTSTTGAAQ